MDVLFNKTNWCCVGSSMWSMVVLLVSCLCGKTGVLFILGMIACVIRVRGLVLSSNGNVVALVDGLFDKTGVFFGPGRGA